MHIRFAPNTLYYGDCLDITTDFIVVATTVATLQIFL